MKYMYEHYFESSDAKDCADEKAMMQAIPTEEEHAQEHVLNFKGPTKGH